MIKDNVVFINLFINTGKYCLLYVRFFKFDIFSPVISIPDLHPSFCSCALLTSSNSLPSCLSPASPLNLAHLNLLLFPEEKKPEGGLQMKDPSPKDGQTCSRQMQCIEINPWPQINFHMSSYRDLAHPILLAHALQRTE